MELNELIVRANGINAFANNENWSEATRKEMKKIEMYCRKTYLMLKHVDLLVSNDEEEGLDENEFLSELSEALVRDQKYVKARDSLGDYTIG